MFFIKYFLTRNILNILKKTVGMLVFIYLFIIIIPECLKNTSRNIQRLLFVWQISIKYCQLKDSLINIDLYEVKT